MASSNNTSRLRCLALIVLAVPSPLFAQAFPSQPRAATGLMVQPLPDANDPNYRYRQNLITLSRSPKDVNALIEAGKSAIEIGDGDAALSFLARAEELAPNDGRVKAALGSALMLVERPADALRLFNEATALGVPDFVIARDRGLAYDLRGDSRNAQRDYQLALRQAPDDEVVRRLALSLGISGDRDQALRLLDPLLRKQDPTGWRARAFVLAMNGDVRGAEAIAAQVMPAGMAETMRPFLRRLASLNASDRALAVNYGTMPGDGRQQVASAEPLIRSSGGLIPAPDLAPTVTPDSAAASRKTEPVSKAPRRRPGRTEVAAASPPSSAGPGFSDIFAKSIAAPASSTGVNDQVPPPVQPESKPLGVRLDQRVGKRIGPVDPARLSPQVRDLMGGSADSPAPSVQQVPESVFTRRELSPVTVAAAERQPQAQRPPVKRAPEPEELDQQTAPVFEVPAAPVAVDPPPREVVPAAAVNPIRETPPAQPVAVAAVTPQSAPERVVAASPPTAILPAKVAVAPREVASGLAGILADVQPEPESAAAPLPSSVEIKLQRLAAQRKVADAAAKVKAEKEALAKAEKDKADRAAAELAKAAKLHPPRVWVQIATGANESGLGITWKRIKDKAPDAFKGLTASYVPFKATNRILVGPFKGNSDARALVTAMGKAGISGNTFSSEAGQEISKIASK